MVGRLFNFNFFLSNFVGYLLVIITKIIPRLFYKSLNMPIFVVKRSLCEKFLSTVSRKIETKENSTAGQASARVRFLSRGGDPR